MSILAIYKHKGGKEVVLMVVEVVCHEVLIKECLRRLKIRVRSSEKMHDKTLLAEKKKELEFWMESVAAGKFSNFECLTAVYPQYFNESTVTRSIAHGGYAVENGRLVVMHTHLNMTEHPVLMDVEQMPKPAVPDNLVTIQLRGTQFRYYFTSDNLEIFKDKDRIVQNAVMSFKSYVRRVIKRLDTMNPKTITESEAIAKTKEFLKDMSEKFHQGSNEGPSAFYISFLKTQGPRQKSRVSAGNSHELTALKDGFMKTQRTAQSVQNFDQIMNMWNPAAQKPTV